MSRRRYKIFTTPTGTTKRIRTRDRQDLFGARGQASTRSALLLEVLSEVGVAARGELRPDPAAAHLRPRPYPGRQSRRCEKTGGQGGAEGQERLALRAL